jgi:hypothetical protein
MTGAGHGPRRQTQQHKAAGLRLFRGAGTHEGLVYLIIHGRQDDERDGRAERKARERANGVRRHRACRPLVQERRECGHRSDQDGCRRAKALRHFLKRYEEYGESGAGVDAGAARAHGQLPRPQLEGSRRLLMADDGADGIRQNSRGMRQPPLGRSARREGRQRQQQSPDNGRADEGASEPAAALAA